MKDKITAVALFSGGLDSILAVKLIQEQGIEVKGVNFKTPFFGLNKTYLAVKNLKSPVSLLEKGSKVDKVFLFTLLDREDVVMGGGIIE